MPHDEPMLSDEAKRANEQAALKAAYRAVFAHPLAEAVLKDLIDQGGLFRENTDAANPACLNPVAVGVFEGRRRLVLRIVSMAELDVTAIMAAAKFQRPHDPRANGKPRQQTGMEA